MNIGARLIEEYRKLKEEHPDEILLYQVGTFYKIMLDDAQKTAGPLELKLFVTGEAESPVPVCGFPKSGLDKYVGKLARAGLAVAICEQRSDGGAMRREVVEVLRCEVRRPDRASRETGSDGKGGGRVLKDLVAFQKSYEAIRWLHGLVMKFPRSERFVLAARTENAAMDLLEAIIEANLARDKAPALDRAETALEKLRIWVRLGFDMRYCALRQYEHASRLLDELGRLLGGWKKRFGRQGPAVTARCVAPSRCGRGADG